MNVTLNSDTVALLIGEIDDILDHADISSGTADDLSNLLNALALIHESSSIAIVPDDENIDDDWDDDSDGYKPDDDGPDDGGQPVPTGWDVAG
jgi:hypothetical protein